MDQADILKDPVERQLTQDAVLHEKNTTNQVVTVTVVSLNGLSIEEYGIWLANTWGIGQKDKNNGILFLIAPHERKVRIEVGLGLENVITDSIAKNIIDHDILPYFRKGDMEQGIIAGHHAILQALDGTPATIRLKKDSDDKFWEKILLLILSPFFAILRLFGIGGRGSGGGFGGGDFLGGGGSFGGGGASGDW